MIELRVDSVPEGLEAHYKADEEKGGFVLDIDGVVEKSAYEQALEEAKTYKGSLSELKSKVDEFRGHNVALRQQLEESGQQPDPTKTADVQSMIDQAIAPMKQHVEQLTAEKTQLSKTLEEVVLSDKIKELGIKYGVQESAIHDVSARAKAVFHVVDGKPIPQDQTARDENGNVLSPETWINKLVKDAPHLFIPSTGSGARKPVNGKSPANMSSTGKIAAGLQKLNK
jgi:hypothetical protein